MKHRLLRTRTFQVTILLLLVVSAAQVFWWILDQAQKTEDLRESLTDLYEQQALAAREMRGLGVEDATIARLYPHLKVEAGDGIAVDPGVLQGLEEDRARWLNQYGWEGSFFLVVLVVSMAAVWRALSQEAILRRRQQNFIAAISHELKSPLASMQLSVETLSLRELPREKVRELVERMAADTDRMSDMIAKILDAARLDQRHLDLKFEPVALLPTLRRALSGLENRRVASSAEVQIEVDPEIEVVADPIGVETVLRNLLDNAFRSVSSSGGGNVLVHTERTGAFVHLTLRDNGGGFRSEEADLLFDKFYRPGDELQRSGAGQGLGLYIVRRFVELQRGRVRAHSEGIGKGATFEVWWHASKEGEA
jgi:signal transduction histidine kinase